MKAMLQKSAQSRFEVRPIGGPVGAEILGIDLSQPLDAERIDAVRSALFEFGAIFFRDQKLSPPQHVAFADSVQSTSMASSPMPMAFR
jgi:taurine dioxygenase